MTLFRFPLAVRIPLALISQEQCCARTHTTDVSASPGSDLKIRKASQLSLNIDTAGQRPLETTLGCTQGLCGSRCSRTLIWCQCSAWGSSARCATLLTCQACRYGIVPPDVSALLTAFPQRRTCSRYASISLCPPSASWGTACPPEPSRPCAEHLRCS